jgi:hypothetical protein
MRRPFRHYTPAEDEIILSMWAKRLDDDPKVETYKAIAKLLDRNWQTVKTRLDLLQAAAVSGATLYPVKTWKKAKR